MFIEPQVLIISNRFDFSSDFITAKLREISVPFLRLNRDDLDKYSIKVDPLSASMVASIDNVTYSVSEKNLKSIYYRAPTFLREIFHENIPAEEQLYKTQWAAFVRSLIIFESAKWVNDPVATYKAEMKPFQLRLAKQIGFAVPETLITNEVQKNDFDTQQIAIKSIDTAIVSNGENEAFIYTTLLDRNDLKDAHYSSPFFLQTGLIPKVDVRITVIDDIVVPIKIISENEINEDWRKYKGNLKYELFDLPEDIASKCLILRKKLGLNYCAIDMAIHKNSFYFIEVNPTGEWAWLQKNTGYEFDSKIAQSLI